MMDHQIAFKTFIILATIVLSVTIYFMQFGGNIIPTIQVVHKTPALYKNPWENVPDFVLYLRLTSNPRFVQEYEHALLRTMKIFFPQERAKLLVVLDDEKEEDHKLGDKIHTEWPFPEVCYAKPLSSDIYHNWGKSRMFLDMMYPDLCTNAAYVGYIDADTFFTTVVTPQLFFNDQGKPIIIAKIGQVPYPCWAQSTATFLGKKEVMQCMSTFPVMVKTQHMRAMRNVLAKQHGKPFDHVFRDSAANNQAYCVCQFSIMCNYLWYYHRDDYEWRLQMVPDGNWRGEQLLPNQVPFSYYEAEVKHEMRVPMPRSSIHLRYTITKGISYLSNVPPEKEVDDFIKEGLCYSFGFEVCPNQCRKWNQTRVHYHLFSFEFYQWFWDPRCKEEQTKHYANVKELINYYNSTKREMLFNKPIDRFCDML